MNLTENTIVLRLRNVPNIYSTGAVPTETSTVSKITGAARLIEPLDGENAMSAEERYHTTLAKQLAMNQRTWVALQNRVQQGA